MTTKASPLKRALSAAMKAMEPKRYGTKDKAFVCTLCGHDRFYAGEYIALLGMHTLSCAECSHVEFFAKIPKSLD